MKHLKFLLLAFVAAIGSSGAWAVVLPEVQYLTAQQIRDNAADVRIAILGITSTGDHYLNGSAGTKVSQGTLASVSDPTANDVLRLVATTGGYYLKRESDNKYLNCTAGQNFTLSDTPSTVWTVNGKDDANWGAAVSSWDDLFTEIAHEQNELMVRFRSEGQYMNGQGNNAVGGLRGGTGAWSIQYVRNCDYDASLTTHTVTYKYKYNGVQFDSEEKHVADGAAYPAPKTFDFADAMTTPSGTVLDDAEVVFDVTFSSFPFTLSPDVENATWYAIKMRDNKYAHADAAAAAGQVTPLAASKGYTDDYKWAFVGTPLGFKIYNKGAASELTYVNGSDNSNHLQR